MNTQKNMSSLIFVIIVLSIIPTTHTHKNVMGEEFLNAERVIPDLSTSKSVDAKLSDVVISVTPIRTSEEDGLTTFNFTITDEKTGAVLSHIDWLITIKDPNNNKLFQSSTIHSHIGKNSFSYGFEKEGPYTISVQVASLGPKMLGMDLPPYGQTRAVISGDPWNGWQNDPNRFFGAKNVNFKLDVSNDGIVTLVDNDNSNMYESKINNSPILEGNNDTKVNVELLTNPQKVVAGQPATIILNVKTDNGTDITHTDILAELSDEKTVLYKSAKQGNPKIAVNGALHGHTGQISFDYVFPQAGIYTLDVKVNSIPASNVMFGSVHPTYIIAVEEKPMTTEEKGKDKENIIEQNEGSNSTMISIIGQESPFYDPGNLEVKKGTIVTFVNNDAIPHTVTSTLDKLGSLIPSISENFDSELLKSGERSEIIFNEEGEFNYFCTIHPFMQGSITVTT